MANYVKNELPRRGLLLLDCSCGAKMVQNVHNNDSHIEQGLSYKCPNRLYQTCNKVYSAKFFKDHATWLRPSEEQII